MDESSRVAILLVDDRALAESTAEGLERGDDRFTVETVSSVSDGLEHYADQEYDCIVSAYDLPERDGIDFLKAVRDSHSSLPFILVGSEEHASEAISAGATDYVDREIAVDHNTVLANRIENAVERNRATREIRERQHDHLFSLFERFPEPTVGYVYEDDGPHVTYVNDAFTDVFGYAPDEALGEHIDELIVPPDRREEALRLDERVSAGELVDAEVRRQAKDGVRDFRFRNRPVPESEIIDGYAIYTDITEWKERERELQRSRARYRSLFENNPLVVWEEDLSSVKQSLDALAAEVSDVEAYLLSNPEELQRIFQQTEIIDINQNAVDYYGAPSKEVLMDNLDQVFTMDAFDTLAAVLAAIAEGETRFRGETVSQTLDGEQKNELLELFVPEEYADDYSRVYVVGTDISERKARERELQRERDRLDEFASIVSHDLHNPLNIATGHLELASEEFDNPHLADARNALERMDTLIEDLLTLAREGKDVGETRPVELANIGDECWRTAGSSSASLHITTNSVIRADPSRLKELLENLMANAVEHSGDDVTVNIGDLPDGFFVADDGPGIPLDERDVVFESGYSTADGGSGFGLAIVEVIAEAHDWDIEIADSDDGGARFEITGVETIA